MSLKGEIAAQAYDEIIKRIKFFKEKKPDFLWHFLPKLKEMNFYGCDFLYFQWEHAEDIYFILEGKVMLKYDIMKGKADPFMMPFNMYAEGSYFGDSDVLADKDNEGRDGTACVEEKSRLLVMNR
jgi:hypothetical protein